MENVATVVDAVLECVVANNALLVASLCFFLGLCSVLATPAAAPRTASATNNEHADADDTTNCGSTSSVVAAVGAPEGDSSSSSGGGASREGLRQQRALEQLASFRARVDRPALTDAQRRFLSDATLLRYLRARDGDADQSYDMLRATLEWRAEHMDHLDCSAAIATIPCAACAADPASHCFFSVGTDDRGWPVVYACAGRSTSKQVESNVLHTALEIERLFDGNRGSGKYVWLLDFSGMSFRDVGVRMAQKGLGLFVNHYPERLGEIVLYNPPALFAVLYKAVLPILDAVTKEKITFLRGSDALRRYAKAHWRHDTPMATWLECVLLSGAIPARPGCYPPRSLNERLSDPCTRRYLARFSLR